MTHRPILQVNTTPFDLAQSRAVRQQSFLSEGSYSTEILLPASGKPFSLIRRKKIHLVH